MPLNDRRIKMNPTRLIIVNFQPPWTKWRFRKETCKRWRNQDSSVSSKKHWKMENNGASSSTFWGKKKKVISNSIRSSFKYHLSVLRKMRTKLFSRMDGLKRFYLPYNISQEAWDAEFHQNKNVNQEGEMESNMGGGQMRAPGRGRELDAPWPTVPAGVVWLDADVLRAIITIPAATWPHLKLQVDHSNESGPHSSP